MKVEKILTNRVKFTFVVSKEEFDHALDYAYDAIKENIEIKGFRKGNVSRKVYINHYGVESLYEEALNHVFHHKYHEALANKDYILVGEPKPEVDFEKVNVEGNFEIAFESAIKPEVELGDYKGIEVTKRVIEVTNEEVEQRLNTLAEKNVSLVAKEDGIIENGNTAIFDFEGFHKGEPFEGGKAENHQLEIGSGQFIPGFEEQMVGMKVGDNKDINITFPEQYHAEDLAGEDAVFKIKLHEVKVKEEVEFNDEWVKTLGREEQTLSDLKAALQVEIKNAKENSNKNLAMEEALEKIAANAKVDVPKEMVDYEVEQQIKNLENQAKQYGLDFETYLNLTGMDEEALRASMEVESAKRVLNSLVIEAVALKEAFVVTPEDLEEKYNEIALMYQMPIEEVKKHLTDDLISRDVEFAKALDFIYDNLKFV